MPKTYHSYYDNGASRHDRAMPVSEDRIHMENRKRIIPAAVILVVLVCVAAFSYKYIGSKKWNVLTVADLDVGKADAAVITCGDITGIIDTGTGDAYDIIDSYLKRSGDSDIEFMILSHYDKDHIGSAAKIIREYPVGSIYLPDYVSEKEYYPVLMEAVKDRDNVFYVDQKETVTYGDIKIVFYPPSDPASILENGEKPDNNMSLMCMLSYGDNRLLFTGDIEKARIKQIMDSDVSRSDELDADWIKIPHHGKYQKAEKDLLELTTPVYAVISTSEDEAPNEKLIKLLADEGIETYGTVSGNIITLCDKNTMSVSVVPAS